MASATNAANSASTASTKASSASTSATEAASSAVMAQSYAKGGTGSREGEDADNAKYYAEQAKAVANIDIATTEKAGIVKPDGTSVTVDPDGTIHANTEALSDIGNVDIQNPLDKQSLVYDAASGKWKNGQGSVSSVISDAWNASITYAVGQYCIYNNSLWKCLVQNNGQTPTEGTYWTKVSVANEIASVNSSLSDVKTYNFTPTTDNLSMSISAKNGIAIIQCNFNFLPQDAWKVVTIGKIENWNTHVDRFPITSISNPVSTVLIEIESDGTVKLITYAATQNQEWYYGFAIALI